MSKQVKMVMSKSEFVEFLAKQKGCQFINILSMTEPDMYLTDNPFRGRVKKITIAPMQFGYDYEKSVNNRLEKNGLETSFIGEPLKWGHWVKGMENKVIEHKDELYMRTYCVRKSNPHIYYILDGKLVTKEEFEIIKTFFKKSSSSKKQDESGLTEEFQVKPRTYKLSSLIAVTINKKRIYII